VLPGSSSPCSRRSQRSDPSERKTERDRQREGGKEGDTECVCKDLWLCPHRRICIYVCIHICTPTCVCVCVCVHIYIRIYIHTYTYTYILHVVVLYTLFVDQVRCLLKGEGGSSSKTPTTIDDAVRLCATRVRLPRGLFVHAAKKWKERAGGRVEAS
jgi:hypothetical protein